MQYRREIDGLRAVAVVPVILFHAGIAPFSGGFVGVDVFFVISGYLITSILVAELERGDFSIARFYERRARRILPALFLVMACCIPFAWYLMLPHQFEEFAASIVAVTLFGSNILFWRQTGYFATDAELRPLLHTWSLAVEEQYYLLFPIFLAVCWRWGRGRVLLLIALAAAASLALSQWASEHAESANFYLAPTRAWELLAGSICAFVLRGRQPFASNWLSAAGLVLIILAILTFNDTIPFPGLYGLVPVGGTVLIILYGGTGTAVARLLGLPVFVGIGLISYSAYLWHQPLFAFARLGSNTEPAPWLMIALAALSLVLAALSWRFVEQPFRRGPRSLLPRRAGLFAVSGACAAALIAVGAAAFIARPPTRLQLAHPALVANASHATSPAAAPARRAQPCPGFTNSDPVTCERFGDGPETVAIWGDSHAVMLGLVATPVEGKTIYVLGHWGCPPVLGVARQDRFGNAYFCDRIGVIDGYARYVESLNPDKVFIVARWTMYANGRHIQSRLQRDTSFVTDGRAEFLGADSSTEVLRDGLARTVARLSRIAEVSVVQQVPDLHDYTPRGLLLLPQVPRPPIEAWHTREASILDAAERAGARIVRTHSLYCGERTCAIRESDTPLYRDDNHLNYLGAREFYLHLANLM